MQSTDDGVFRSGGRAAALNRLAGCRGGCRAWWCLVLAGTLMANVVAHGMDPPLAGDPPASVSEADSPAGPRSPLDEQACFRLADPELVIELVACEPAIVSPVALAWDENGRMFVAEMIGYPETEKQGRISWLEDRDGDGSYETSGVFAEGLNYPASVLPSREGLLVADAPDIVFIRDADGDGRADQRRVRWTGFHEGSQQLRVNGLHRGIDNFIYGANGRCDGVIRAAGADPATGISIRGRDFRFHDSTGLFQAIAGQSQFGQTHDDWGRRYLSWNTIPIRQAVFADAVLARFPELTADTIVDSAAPDDTGRVFPIAPRPRQFNGEPVEYYNASCGLTIFRGDAMGDAYRGDAFFCESLGSLVSRRKWTGEGPVMVAGRVEADQEFLASSDGWFHPVFLATGPDGSLYIVDFYRELVEHPLYVASAEVRSQVDFRKGWEHGRIWRIRHCDHRHDSHIHSARPGVLQVSELVETLSHPVGWWRDTAQRLLVERKQVEAFAALVNLLERSESDVGRLHALWTLEGLGLLSDELLLKAVADRSGRVREQAIRIVEERLSQEESAAGQPGSDSRRNGALRAAVVDACEDPDPGVRLQAATALIHVDPAARLEGLLRLAERDHRNRWIARAIFAAAGRSAPLLVRTLTENDVSWASATDVFKARFLVWAGEAIGRRDDEETARGCVAWIAQTLGSGEQASAAERRERIDGYVMVLAGVARGLSERGSALWDVWRSSAESGTLRGAAAKSLVDSAALLSGEPSRPEDLRAAAVGVLMVGDVREVSKVAVRLVLEDRSGEVIAAAARCLSDEGDAEALRQCYDRWDRMGPAARRALLASAPRSPSAVTALMEAIESGTVRAAELPATIASHPLGFDDPELKNRWQDVIRQGVSDDRAAVVSDYQHVLGLAGSPARGAALFQENCLICHSMLGVGRRIGPDLASVGGRPKEVVIVDILDPSRTVSPDFLAYQLVTAGGRISTGLIRAESSEGLSLQLADGELRTYERDEIESLRATGKSFMPDGLEVKLGQQGLADVLAFLYQPDRTLLSKFPLSAGKGSTK